MNSFFLAAAVIIIKLINKMKILRICKIRRKLNLAVYSMCVANVEDCFYSINIFVFVACVWNKLVTVSILFCKNFIPGNKVCVAVAEDDYNCIAIVTC